MKPTGPAGRRVNILVVEDDPGIAQLLRSVFDDIPGWDTLIVGDAETAQRVLSHADMDVLLVDVNLPGMNGTDLLAHVRDVHAHDERSLRRPAGVLMSTDSQAPQVQAALTSGTARDFVAKPFDLDLLVDVLTRAISPAGAAGGAGQQRVENGATLQSAA